MGGWVVQTPTACSMVSANLWQGMGGAAKPFRALQLMQTCQQQEDGCKNTACTAADAHHPSSAAAQQMHSHWKQHWNWGHVGWRTVAIPGWENPTGHPQSKMGHLGGIWGFRIGRTEMRRAGGWDEAVLTPRTARSHQHIPKLCSHRGHLWGHGTRKRCHSSLIPAQGTARAFGSGAQKAHTGGLGRLSTSTAFAREQSAGK